MALVENPHILASRDSEIVVSSPDIREDVTMFSFAVFSRSHPSRDVIFFGQISARKRQKIFLYMTSGSLSNKYFGHHVM